MAGIVAANGTSSTQVTPTICAEPKSKAQVWFAPIAVDQFHKARATAIRDGQVQSADSRAQDIAAYPLGRYQSPNKVEGMPVWFEAWAQPDAKQLVFKDMFSQWFTSPMPAGFPKA
jgi:hypothetical protein